jgi:hypothetical protein
VHFQKQISTTYNIRRIQGSITSEEMFLSNLEGLSLAKMDLSFDSSGLTQDTIKQWRE